MCYPREACALFVTKHRPHNGGTWGVFVLRPGGQEGHLIVGQDADWVPLLSTSEFHQSSTRGPHRTATGPRTGLVAFTRCESVAGGNPRSQLTIGVDVLPRAPQAAMRA